MNIACTVFAFDRPGYFSQTLESLEIQTKSDVDWFIFIDSPILHDNLIGDEKGWYEVIKIAHESDLPIEEVFIAQKNKSIARQKLFAHDLFNYYDKVIFFEDDMIVSKHYIEVLLALQKRYGHDFVTACDRHEGISERDYEERELNAVGNWNTHFWGYLMSPKACRAVHSLLEEYCEIIGEDYKRRPHGLIRNKFGLKATSHDGILEKGLRDNGIPRLTTKIPRARYIGETGVHNSPERFRRQGYHIKREFEFKDEPYRYESADEP